MVCTPSLSSSSAPLCPLSHTPVFLSLPFPSLSCSISPFLFARRPAWHGLSLRVWTMPARYWLSPDEPHCAPQRQQRPNDGAFKWQWLANQRFGPTRHGPSPAAAPRVKTFSSQLAAKCRIAWKGFDRSRCARLCMCATSSDVYFASATQLCYRSLSSMRNLCLQPTWLYFCFLIRHICVSRNFISASVFVFWNRSARVIWRASLRWIKHHGI